MEITADAVTAPDVLGGDDASDVLGGDDASLDASFDIPQRREEAFEVIEVVEE